MTGDDEHLILFLRDTGLLSRGQISAVQLEATRHEESFYHCLLKSAYLHEDDVRRALAKALTIPFVSLSPERISPESMFVLPEAFCRTHSLVAYKEENGRLMLAVLDLDSVAWVTALRLPYTVVPHLTDRQTIKRALLHYQKLLKEHHSGVVSELIKSIEPPLSNSAVDLRYSAERLSVGQLVDVLFGQALSQRATDIHFEPRAQGFIVRYRVGERLYDALQLPLSVAASILARIKMLAKLDLSSNFPQEGRFTVISEYGNNRERITFRVATMPIAHEYVSEKIVVHLAREKEGKNGFMLESLGLHGAGLGAMHCMLSKQSGLLLVCGGPKSGATTLLYTLLDHCIDPTRSVVTIENELNIRLSGAVQTEVRSHTGITPLSCLDAALRMDPDVLMVSECDSQELLLGMVRAANEGRFVLTRVGSSTPADVLATFGATAGGQTLSSALVGVVSTGLLRKLCTVHEKTKLSRPELEELEARGANLPKILELLKEEGRIEPQTQWKDLLFGRPTPCENCDGGYVGMVGLQEVVPMSVGLKELVAGSAQAEDIEAHIRNEGRTSLLEEGIFNAALGLTSIDEVFSASL